MRFFFRLARRIPPRKKSFLNWPRRRPEQADRSPRVKALAGALVAVVAPSVGSYLNPLREISANPLRSFYLAAFALTISPMWCCE
jgi:hypothetical protein